MLKPIARTVQRLLGHFGYFIDRKEKYLGINPENWIQKLSINTVLDIGANEGQFIGYIRKFLPVASIHSFEPIRACFETLQKIDDKNLSLYNYGLSNEEGTTEINISKNLVSSSIFGANEILTSAYPDAAYVNKETIQLARLDHLLKNVNLKSNILVKIDVQGYEEMVIAGGKETLAKASAIWIEASFRQLYAGQWLFDEVYQSLREMGFVFNGLLEQFESKDSKLPIYGDALFIKKEMLETLY